MKKNKNIFVISIALLLILAVAGIVAYTQNATPVLNQRVSMSLPDLELQTGKSCIMMEQGAISAQSIPSGSNLRNQVDDNSIYFDTTIASTGSKGLIFNCDRDYCLYQYYLRPSTQDTTLEFDMTWWKYDALTDNFVGDSIENPCASVDYDHRSAQSDKIKYQGDATLSALLKGKRCMTDNFPYTGDYGSYFYYPGYIYVPYETQGTLKNGDATSVYYEERSSGAYTADVVSLTYKKFSCSDVSAGSCTDSIKNNHETDIDCGGINCAKCALTKSCLVATDCLSNYCNPSTYKCANGIGTDTDQDGISDLYDLCPYELENYNGYQDTDGCPDTAPIDDDDKDGVINSRDVCPNTPTGSVVDASGCTSAQRDTDGDGVKDNVDLCPNIVGPSTNNGCPLSSTDADKDGVFDSNDRCPNTPTSQTVDSNGCSSSQRDTDGDTIMDNIDQCPNTPQGETPNANGCSCSQRDGDNDGIKDCTDMCPNTPTGSVVGTNGCTSTPTDSDGDGTPDTTDDCPNVVGPKSNNGCPLDNDDYDGDGVPDNMDDCPIVAGLAIYNGCLEPQTGMTWWVWLLIGLGVVFVVLLIVLIIVALTRRGGNVYRTTRVVQPKRRRYSRSSCKYGKSKTSGRCLVMPRRRR